MRSALATALDLATKFVSAPVVTALSLRLRGETATATATTTATEMGSVRSLAASTLLVDMSASFPASIWKTYTVPTAAHVIDTFESTFAALANINIKVVSFDAQNITLASSSSGVSSLEDSFGLIVGVAVGAVALLITLGFCWCFLRSRVVKYVNVDDDDLPEGAFHQILSNPSLQMADLVAQNQNRLQREYPQQGSPPQLGVPRLTVELQ